MAVPEPVAFKSTNSDEDARLAYAASAMQGYGVQMEDAHVTMLQLHAATETSFFAVYDGHGGPAVAKFCQKHLHAELLKHEEFQTNLPNALQSTFLRMDVLLRDKKAAKELCKHGGNEQWKKYKRDRLIGFVMPCQKPAYEGPVGDGCTACVALIRGNHIIVANAGDSCCVLSRKGQATDLSRDHKPNVPAETQRIEHAGDQVKIANDVESLVVACVGILISRPDMVGLMPSADRCTECVIIKGKQLIVGKVSDSNCVPSMNMQEISASIDHNSGGSAKKQRTEYGGHKVTVSTSKGEINDIDKHLVISMNMQEISASIGHNPGGSAKKQRTEYGGHKVTVSTSKGEINDIDKLLVISISADSPFERLPRFIDNRNVHIKLNVTLVEPKIQDEEFRELHCLTGFKRKREDVFETYYKCFDESVEENGTLNIVFSSVKGVEFCGSSCVTGTKRKRGDTSETHYNLNDKVQFTVKIFGRSLSVQKDLNQITVKELVLYCCQTLNVGSPDIYALLGGRPLCNNYFLSQYPIHRDSTVEVRTRLRGGQPEPTFTRKFLVNDKRLTYRFYLPNDLINTVDKKSYIRKLKRFTRYNFKEALVCLTSEHENGGSYNGGFESDDLLYEGNHVRMRETVIRVPFSGPACKKDYGKLADIFEKRMSHLGNPQYFQHLLDYLRACPAGANSNHRAAIAFAINHPALECYLDRTKQSNLLDNVLHRLDDNDWNAIAPALGASFKWWNKLVTCPEMEPSLFCKSRSQGGRLVWNKNFTQHPLGAIHYSNIFFKHAPNHLTLEEMEAAHSHNMPDHLPDVLQRIAIFLSDPRNAGFVNRNRDLVELLGNALANRNSGR